MKHSVRSLPLALLVVSGLAIAAEPIEGQFSVTGTVPTESFSIIDTGNWMSRPQTLTMNILGTGFTRFNETMLLKSTVGTITGYLVEPARLRSGDNELPMVVSVNGRHLKDFPQNVLTASQAAPGKLVNFETYIDYEVLQGPYPPGEYSGTYNMMFETAPPL